MVFMRGLGKSSNNIFEGRANRSQLKYLVEGLSCVVVEEDTKIVIEEFRSYKDYGQNNCIFKAWIHEVDDLRMKIQFDITQSYSLQCKGLDDPSLNPKQLIFL